MMIDITNWWRKKRGTPQYALLFLCFFSWQIHAQVPPTTAPSQPLANQAISDTGRVIVLPPTQLGEFIMLNGVMVQKLKGTVRLKHKDAIVYCDSAILDNATNNITAKGNVVINQGDTLNIFADSMRYYGLNRTADLYGDVILVNNDKKLYTNKLNYNLNTKIATYNTKSTLVDSRSQLSSKRGSYNVASGEAFFKDQVLVADKEFDLKTDTLKFNVKSNIATFLAPTLIFLKDTAQFYTEQGFYDLKKDQAAFTKSPQYKKKDQVAQSDTMLYDGLSKVITLKGKANTRDSVREARAETIRYNRKTEESWLEGAASYKDKDQNITADSLFYNAKTKTYATRGRSKVLNGAQTIEANRIDFNNTDSLGYASGNVIWRDTASQTDLRCTALQYSQKNDYIKASGDRPLLSTLVDNDTLWLRADTILSFKADPTDSFRTMRAYNRVKMFKKDFQSVSDSLVYIQRDSTFWLYNNPIIWSDTSQLTADTMRILLKDKKLDRVLMRQNAFIVNSKDAVYYNQIKGKDITAQFKDDNLRQMNVEGNAESVYYALDDKEAYIGVNKAICSEMVLYFGDNKVDRIKFLSQPQATMYPMKKADHEALKLKGFKWEIKARPKSAADLK